jgi:hypothetical protein
LHRNDKKEVVGLSFSTVFVAPLQWELHLFCPLQAALQSFGTCERMPQYTGSGGLKFLLR